MSGVLLSRSDFNALDDDYFTHITIDLLAFIFVKQLFSKSKNSFHQPSSR